MSECHICGRTLGGPRPPFCECADEMMALRGGIGVGRARVMVLEMQMEALHEKINAQIDGPFSEAWASYHEHITESILTGVCERVAERFPYSYGPQLEKAIRGEVDES